MRNPDVSSRQRPAAMLMLLTLVLAITDVLLIDQRPWSIAVAVVSSGVLVVITRRRGFTAGDLGLARQHMWDGVIWGSAVAAIAITGYVMIAMVPMFASAFDDARVPDTPIGLAVRILVFLPLRTVLLEELAFRGLIWGAVSRDRGPAAATVVSSIAFGLWHLAPALVVLRTNAGLAGLSGTWWGATLAVVGILAGTAAAGIVLGELRRRSGSLLAPAIVHWTVNATSVLLVFFAR